MKHYFGVKGWNLIADSIVVSLNNIGRACALIFRDQGFKSAHFITIFGCHWSSHAVQYPDSSIPLSDLLLLWLASDCDRIVINGMMYGIMIVMVDG